MIPDGWIYIRIIKEMYGLPQVGSLANKVLELHLNHEGYYQNQCVPWLWKHKTCKLQFMLVVHYFGIKYIKEEYLDHIIQALKGHYYVALDKGTQIH